MEITGGIIRDIAKSPEVMEDRNEQFSQSPVAVRGGFCNRLCRLAS
jgi:hypothetical protein